MATAELRLVRGAAYQAILDDGTPIAVWCVDEETDAHGRARVRDALGQEWNLALASLTPMADPPDTSRTHESPRSASRRTP